LGLRLEEFYDMTWREFLLKSFAHKRMEEEKLQHMRFIAYKTTLALILIPNTYQKAFSNFFQLGMKFKYQTFQKNPSKGF